MLAEKEKQSNDKLWRVIMFPLSPASSNVHLILLMGFFMLFCTEALKMSPALVGLILTASRIFNAFTDPILGGVLDKIETKLGKFRPFMICGSLIMNIALLLILQVSFYIPESARLVWVIVWYAIWDLGYSMMTAVNKSALSIVTKNPKQRPVSGIAGGLYSTAINMSFLVGMTPYFRSIGGFGTQSGWITISSIAVIVNIIFLSMAVFAISGKDKPEFFRAANSKREKVKLKDYIEIIKINRPLQMLMISAGSNKLADSIDGGVLIYFYMYAVKDLSIQPLVSGFSTPITIFGAFLAGSVAIKFGLKRAFTYGIYINLIVNALILIIRPFSGNMVYLLIFLMSLISVCRRMTAQNVDPMIAELIDYHNYKTGKFMPGIIGALFSFVDKFISSFAGVIVGSIMALAGYKASAEPTTMLYWTTLLLYLLAPLLADLIGLIAMKFYKIDENVYKEMYGNKTDELNKKNIKAVEA